MINNAIMNLNSKIFVAGHSGLVGSAIVRNLLNLGYENLILVNRSELDLEKQREVDDFFQEKRPDYVFLAAAKVGGIRANMEFPTEFFIKNMRIELNIIESSYNHAVKKLCYLGSSCIYPKDSKQPIKETSLLSGTLEKTNEPYALAKIAGLKLCEYFNQQYDTRFITTMPASVYGIHDNFSTTNGHVLPSLISKIHSAKVNSDPEVSVWGTGEPRREFINSDDLATALIFLMNSYDGYDLINIGVRKDYRIIDIVDLLCEIINYKGTIVLDKTKPDGVKAKLLDSSKIFNLGWQPKIDFKSGLSQTYSWFKSNAHSSSRI
jgi:GDP-L-fucose synthase